jgi:hypothetical protein
VLDVSILQIDPLVAEGTPRLGSVSGREGFEERFGPALADPLSMAYLLYEHQFRPFLSAATSPKLNPTPGQEGSRPWTDARRVKVACR